MNSQKIGLISLVKKELVQTNIKNKNINNIKNLVEFINLILKHI